MTALHLGLGTTHSFPVEHHARNDHRVTMHRRLMPPGDLRQVSSSILARPLARPGGLEIYTMLPDVRGGRNHCIREEARRCLMDERDVSAVPPATAIAVAALPYVGQWRMNPQRSDLKGTTISFENFRDGEWESSFDGMT